ncbi:MAG TPA: transglutaminase family protein [Kiritimatiellia bacterium]|nr:transglutaminase family protein [Kiritimatiellia bacterium]
MRYHIRHRTEYLYAEPVLVSLNQVCLTPRDTALQRVPHHKVWFYPVPHARTAWIDCFGNLQIQCCFSEPHPSLVVDAESRVELEPMNRPPLETGPAWESAVQAVRAHADFETLDALQFIYDSPFVRSGPAFRALAEPDFPPGAPLPLALANFAARFQREFTYDAGATTLHTPIEDVLADRRGVCQDFTLVMIAALRSLGLAARYVSGYLRTLPPPGQPRLVGADASHCWVSVFAPGWGWIDVDPTNGCLVSDQHITIAWGRDYADVTPVKGVILGGGSQQITVSVDVVPEDDPA